MTVGVPVHRSRVPLVPLTCRLGGLVSAVGLSFIMEAQEHWRRSQSTATPVARRSSAAARRDRATNTRPPLRCAPAVNRPSVPGATRTHDLPLRRRLLYPTELPEPDARTRSVNDPLVMAQKGRSLGRASGRRHGGWSLARRESGCSVVVLKRGARVGGARSGKRRKPMHTPRPRSRGSGGAAVSGCDVGARALYGHVEK